jgi:RNA polymerase sigma factor (TIGR02999 family)
MSDITRILSQIEEGDGQAAEQLLPLVYDELRRLAKQKMDREPSGQTLQATALVHEAYIRLVDGKRARHWQGRRHFFLAASEAMRRILVDQARRKRSSKRGGDRQRVGYDKVAALSDDRTAEVLAVHEALDDLAAESPVKAELVKLRYFAGMSVQEAGEALGISRATADRYWTYARTYLYCAIEDADSSEEAGDA